MTTYNETLLILIKHHKLEDIIFQLDTLETKNPKEICRHIYNYIDEELTIYHISEELNCDKMYQKNPWSPELTHSGRNLKRWNTVHKCLLNRIYIPQYVLYGLKKTST